MFHLICNAHLDPVWLWRWDEGASETLSTFRAAADFLDEYPELIFCHNESLLYEWIEEYDPALFARIRKHVQNDRWAIIGGWFLQPDVNLPMGESIVRQTLRGQRYFHEKFGKLPTVANNFDSFGHARGLVQLLRQCGYEQYLVCRPKHAHYPFPDADFVWEGYDGSRIVVHRSDENYNSIKGKVGSEIVEWMEKHPGNSDGLFLWGVGNHGGGPSRKDLDDLRALIEKGVAIRHAVPEQYFATVDSAKMPLVQDGLNPTMEGCYTSQIRVKQQHRRLENELAMVEKMASHAAIRGLARYEKALLDDAWRDLLFAEFHDALPGSAIPSVEEDTLRTLDHGLEIAARLKTKYLFALSAGQEKLTPETSPLLVYNPHPFPVKTLVDASFVLPKQNWNAEFSVPVVMQGGKRLPCQTVKEESNFNMDWCKRTVFLAELPASSMSRFDVHYDIRAARPQTATVAVHGKIEVATARGRVIVNALTGLVDSFCVDGVETLRPGSFALEVFEDSVSPWNGDFDKETKAPIGRFELMSAARATAFAATHGDMIEPVRVIEEGEARTVIEAIFTYNDSRAVQRYIVDRFTGALDLETSVFFGEKEKRLKMSVPSAIEGGEYIGQTMFGREKLDIRAGEVVAQAFTCIAGEDQALLIVNDSTYGSDFTQGSARITLLRSVAYSAGKFTLGDPMTEAHYMPRMEQGERKYRFRILGGRKDAILACADREAALLNQRPYALPYCPSGEGEKPGALVAIDRDNVTLSCFKRAEDGEDAYIARVFEAQGKPTHFTLDVPALGARIQDALEPFKIKTYRVEKGRIAETTMLEGLR